jgi:Rrf2 family iron-sulfur cluster assembly transcriptional regulator
MTHELWTDLNRHMFDFLDSVTLASLVERQRKAGSSVTVLKDERRVRRREAAISV